MLLADHLLHIEMEETTINFGSKKYNISLYLSIYNYLSISSFWFWSFILFLVIDIRIAVVTGANKGIGLEISKQLAAKGVGVVLTARDVKRGTEAAENLKASGFSDVVFHQLDVTEPTTIASLAYFLETQFGKLDILVLFSSAKTTITSLANFLDRFLFHLINHF